MKKTVMPLVLPLLALLGTITTLVGGWKPNLGLDLQGGASVVLKPTRPVPADQLAQTVAVIRQRVDALGVAEPEVVPQGDSIIVSLPGVKDRNRVLDVVGTTAELRFRIVAGVVPNPTFVNADPAATTVPGGSTVPASSELGNVSTAPGSTAPGSTAPGSTAPGSTAPGSTASGSTAPGSTAPGSTAPGSTVPGSTAAGSTVPATTIAGSATTAAAFGSGPGAGRFAADVAATSDPATSAPGSTLPDSTAPGSTVPGSTVPGSTVPGSTVVAAAPTGSTLLCGNTPVTFADPPALTPRAADVAEAAIVAPSADGSLWYLLCPAAASGTIVENAGVSIDQNGRREITMDFTDSGGRIWGEVTSANIGQAVAIVLDTVVQSAPTIQGAITDGRGVITGDFDQKESENLATVLRFGALPVQLEPQTIESISPTLGRDSLNAGIITGLIGLLLVCAYMIFYYRSLGLIVVAGLLVSFGLMWSLVTWLSETQGLALSLSGAVGIIVSVGVTVDSYVVFFERLKDEIRAGRSLGASIDHGFQRAWRTILSADVTSLIGAGILYFLTVGGVRGFALFLAISTVLDMVVAYWFTRPVVARLAQTKFFTSGPLGIARGVPIPTRPVQTTTTGLLVPSKRGSK